MRKLPWFLPLLLATAAYAQRGGAVTNKYAPYVPTCVTAPTAGLSCPTDGYVCVYNTTLYRCTQSGGWDTIVGSTSSGLPADPAACGAGEFVVDIDADGTLTCSTPAGAGDMLKATYDTDADNVVDSAEALATNPAACSAGNYVSDIAADGTLTCGTPAGSGDMLKATYDTNADGVVNNAADLSGCTDCIGPTEITDSYLLNTGDDGTGVYTFNSATSLSIPAGTAPTSAAAGQVSVDTTEDQFLYYGASTRVMSYVNFFSFTLETPADADNFLVFKAPYDITVTSINCIVDPADSGETVVIDVQERNTSGDSPATLDATITCSNTGAADDGALSNPTVTTGEWVSIDIGTVTGTVTQVVVTVAYTLTRK